MNLSAQTSRGASGSLLAANTTLRNGPYLRRVSNVHSAVNKSPLRCHQILTQLSWSRCELIVTHSDRSNLAPTTRFHCQNFTQLSSNLIPLSLNFNSYLQFGGCKYALIIQGSLHGPTRIYKAAGSLYRIIRLLRLLDLPLPAT